MVLSNSAPSPDDRWEFAWGGAGEALAHATGAGKDRSGQKRLRNRIAQRQAAANNKWADLGVDFDKKQAYNEDGSVNEEYVQGIYKQAREKLGAAGIRIDDDADLDTMWKAYKQAPARQRKAYDENQTVAKPQQDQAERSPSQVGPANGTRQVKPADGQQAGGSPLRPRNGQPQPSAISAGSTSRFGTKADDSGIYVNGAPVSQNDDATLGHVRRTGQKIAAREELQAERSLAQEQTDAKSDPRRNYQKYANDQFDLDRSMDDLRERRRAYREEQEQRRKDRRFQNRDLSNADDWNNLGREGSNRRSYEATAGETADQKKDREAAMEARNKQIAALRDRFAQMSDKTLLKEGEKYEWKDGKAVVTDANGNAVSADELAQRKDSGVGQSEYSYGNKFYANDPNRQKELAALGRLVNAAAEGKTISDAQIEAATKKLDSWQAEADERGARVQSYQNMRNAEQMSNLRRQYGLTDKQAISDQDVMDYHQNQQKAARTEILKGMQVAPGLGPGEAGKSAMTKFSGQWQKLIDAGFNPQEMFAKSMQNADNKKAFMEGMASISGSDPDAADKRDQLRRRFIMQQAMEEHGITQTGGETGKAGSKIGRGDTTEHIESEEDGVKFSVDLPDKESLGSAMAKNLPGRKMLFNSRAEAEANQDRMEALKGPQSMTDNDMQGVLKPKRVGGPDGVTIMRGGSYKDMVAKANEIMASEAKAAVNGPSQPNQLNDNSGMDQYNALVAKNRNAQQAAPAAPVKQTAAPPIPEVPEEKKRTAVKGGVTALRPRRRY